MGKYPDWINIHRYIMHFLRSVWCDIEFSQFDVLNIFKALLKLLLVLYHESNVGHFSNFGLMNID